MEIRLQYHGGLMAFYHANENSRCIKKMERNHMNGPIVLINSHRGNKILKKKVGEVINVE